MARTWPRFHSECKLHWMQVHAHWELLNLRYAKPTSMSSMRSSRHCEWFASLHGTHSLAHGVFYVEELCNHRHQPLGAIHKCHVCRAGKHRELRTWQADEIARHPAAAQAKQLDRVLRADNIRILDDEQSGCLDRTN